MRAFLVFAFFLASLPMLVACEQEQEAEPAPTPETAVSDISAEPQAGEAPDEETALSEDEDDFDYDGLPSGEGQEEVFVNCSGCHSLKLVQQQGLSRHRWEEILDWMVEEQGMAPLDPPEHELVVNYLVTHYGLPE